MSTRETAWPAGTPCWADLMTSDRAAAWRFYHDVLGWHIEDSGAEMGNYGMAYLDGKAVAGIGSPPDPAQAPPPMWTTYLATDDLDKTLTAVSANGGTIAVPVMEVGGAGRMAVAADPAGAYFGMWQKLDFIGSERVKEPGTIVWNENLTRDPARAREFYTAVFGYSYTPMAGDFDYSTIDGAGPGNTVGGIGGLDASAPAETPPAWGVYFMVSNADDTAAKVAGNGGRIITAPYDTPFGRMATVADPQGATFSIMQDTNSTS